jgi:hypothetical protein
MKYLILIFFFVSIILYLSCRNATTEPEPNKPLLSISAIIPERDLKIGEKFLIKLNLQNFDSAILLDHIYFNGLWHYADSIRGDTLFAFVPYIPTINNRWIIEVTAYNKSFDNPGYSAYDTINIIPEVSPKYILIKWSDIDSIKKVDSYSYHRFGESGWFKEEFEDTIIIYQTRPGCDEGSITSTFKFINKGSNNLPELLEFIKIDNCLGTVHADTLTKGILKIQEWNNSIKCGLLLPEIKIINKRELYPHKIIFWIDY